MKSPTPVVDSAVNWLCADQNVALLSLDEHQAVIGANSFIQSLLGYSESQLCQIGLEGLGIKDDVRLQTLLAGPHGRSLYSCQIPIVQSNGKQQGVVATAYRQSDGGHLVKLSPIGSNEQAIAKIRENEERYRLALEAAGIGTWDMDIKRNETRRSLLHDQCFGYSQLQKNWSYDTFLNHVIDQDRARVNAVYTNAMRGGEEYDLCFRVQWPDNSTHWLWSKGQFYLDDSGNPDHVAGIQADVTEEFSLREELRHKATHDHLTGLCNRSCFETNLVDLLQNSQRNAQSVAVILIDIDHFKRFNDAFNHMGGDAVLKAIASRIKAAATTDMLTARFGGDEFVIAIPGASQSASFAAWINDLITMLSEKLPLQQSTVQPTVSVGAAFAPSHGTTSVDLLKAADSAMYEAKRCGRATFRIFNPLDHLSESNSLLLADKIPEALSAGEICLYYQPQFATSDQRLIGMEALLRWFPPDAPPIAPNLLVEAAERSGFISVLGDWVIRETCRQIRDWRNQGLATVPVAINVSGVQFLRGELTKKIKECLEHFQLSGDSLEVEITETIALDNAESVLNELHDLKRAGLGIAIDDFGTGFSSLSYLRYFPVNRIKIDKCFVNGCLDIQENGAICKTIISLAHNLGCQVIAEGVETGEQLDFLLQQGCEEVQGYLLAKPMPPEAASRHLLTQGTKTAKPAHETPSVDKTEAAKDNGQPGDDQSDETVRLRSVAQAKNRIGRQYDKLSRIVEMTAKALGVPMASLNIIERDTVTTMVPFGLPVAEFQRSKTFCNQTVRQIDILEVSDALTHTYFQNLPDVAEAPGIRFYAGLGILAPNHQMIGTLCLFDQQPRELDPLERELLVSMGALIETELARQSEHTKRLVRTVKSRRDFISYLRDYWHKASRADSTLTLIWIGIDKLREVNAEHGLETGDHCLTLVESVIAEFADRHNGAIAFRMEGDNFALLCRDNLPDQAAEIVTELGREFEAAKARDQVVSGTSFAISFGLHSARSNGTVASMDQFIRQARQALYVAKTSGQSSVKTSSALPTD